MTEGKSPRKKLWQPKRAAMEPASAADLIEQVMARLGGPQRGIEQRVFAAYAEVVGAVFARKTQAESFKRGTLFVKVESAPLAHELTLLRSEILARLKTALGADTVTELRTRVGPIE